VACVFQAEEEVVDSLCGGETAETTDLPDTWLAEDSVTSDDRESSAAALQALDFYPEVSTITDA